MKKLSIAAAAIIVATITSASASPIHVSGPAITSSPIVQAQHYRHAAPPPRMHKPRYVAPPPRAHKPRYVPGNRYSSAPRGWHRHHHRPSNWQSLGCVMVGPVWFCP